MTKFESAVGGVLSGLGLLIVGLLFLAYGQEVVLGALLCFLGPFLALVLLHGYHAESRALRAAIDRGRSRLLRS